MIKAFIELAEIVIERGGYVSYEWPAFCLGWEVGELCDLFRKHDFKAAGVTDVHLGLKVAMASSSRNLGS